MGWGRDWIGLDETGPGFDWIGRDGIGRDRGWDRIAAPPLFFIWIDG